MYWLMLVVIFPVVAPLFILWALKTTLPNNGLPREMRELMRPASFFKDDQLCWLAFALSLSAVLELPEAEGTYWVFSGTAYSAVMMALVFGATTSAMSGFLGPILMVPADVPHGVPPLRHFWLLVFSVIQTVCVATIFTAIHFAGTERREKGESLGPAAAETHVEPIKVTPTPVAASASSPASAPTAPNSPSAANLSSAANAKPTPHVRKPEEHSKPHRAAHAASPAAST